LTFHSAFEASLIIKIIRKSIWTGIHTITLIEEGVSNTRDARSRVALVALLLVTN
jgi:hypothetical protein